MKAHMVDIYKLNWKLHPRRHVDRQTSCEVMAIFAVVAILDFIEPEIAQFDPPTLKTLG